MLLLGAAGSPIFLDAAAGLDALAAVWVVGRIKQGRGLRRRLFWESRLAKRQETRGRRVDVDEGGGDFFFAFRQRTRAWLLVLLLLLLLLLFLLS